MIGYDNINPVSPLTENFPNSLTKTDEIKERLKNILSCPVMLMSILVIHSLESHYFQKVIVRQMLINSLMLYLRTARKWRSTLINSAIEKVALKFKEFFQILSCLKLVEFTMN